VGLSELLPDGVDAPRERRVDALCRARHKVSPHEVPGEVVLPGRSEKRGLVRQAESVDHAAKMPCPELEIARGTPCVVERTSSDAGDLGAELPRSRHERIKAVSHDVQDWEAAAIVEYLCDEDVVRACGGS
jgi:hypothetical protein